MQPIHLAKFDCTPNNSFDGSEILFRRCATKENPPYDKSLLFNETRWEDIRTDGISINRNSYSNEEDVLWSPAAEDPINKTCEYELKKGAIFQTVAGLYPTNKDPDTGVSFDLTHSPINCNYSHCDIIGIGFPDKPEPHTRRKIRGFLATFFK